MTLRKRILLIISGILIFSITAPAIVLFARGYFFDFKNFRLISTGILSVKTDPKGAKIRLNGKAASVTPAALRFLHPGEYEVELDKDEYFSWKKRVAIHEHMVTTLPLNYLNKIALLSSTRIQSALSTSTTDFIQTDSGIFYGQNDELRQLQLDNLTSKKTTTTPELLEGHLVEEKAGEFLLKDVNGFWRLNAQTLSRLPDNLSDAKLGPRVGESIVLSVDKKLIYIDAKKNQRILAAGVEDFAVNEHIYFLSRGQLWQTSLGSSPQVLLGELPTFANQQIIATPGNRLFLILDQTLYEVSENLKKLNSSVLYGTWNEEAKMLIYGNNHEIWAYRAQDQKESELITRSTKTLGQPAYSPRIGYLFVSEDKELKAIEIDSSGQPNVYSLTETQNPQIKLAINPEGNYLIYLDDGNLYTLKIR